MFLLSPFPWLEAAIQRLLEEHNMRDVEAPKLKAVLDEFPFIPSMQAGPALREAEAATPQTHAKTAKAFARAGDGNDLTLAVEEGVPPRFD